LTVDGLPADAKHTVVEHFRIDRAHSNAFTTWQEMGSPESLSQEQRERLERDAQLQLLDSPQSVAAGNGKVHLQFGLPRQGMSLLRLRW
jgi:xylan 1,4-beta-xylosidase